MCLQKNVSKVRILEVWNVVVDFGVLILWQQWYCDYGIFIVLILFFFFKFIWDVFLELDVVIKRWIELVVNGDYWKVDYKLLEGDFNQL